MPNKKKPNLESTGSERVTAPKLPKTLSKQVETKAPTLNDQESSQQITVRKLSTSKADNQKTESALPSPDNLDDPETNKAVDDIMAQESDMVLAVDDIMAAKRSQPTPENGWKDRVKKILQNRWTWAAVLVILGVIFILPFTRYKLLGILIKEKVSVSVIDAQTNTPVSNAQINIGGTEVKTDANGLAEPRAGLGQQSVKVTKQYYKTDNTHYFIGLKNNNQLTIKLIATGRLVPVTVDNTISGKPLPGVVIKVLNTTAKTNSSGQTTIALPTNAASYKASLSLSGYNTKKTSIEVTSMAIKSNIFSLTPAGSIYFLSNENSTIDVVKSNLDGSNRQIVLEGTGHESANTTRLLASNDWHYLVLEANRNGQGPALYLINTSNNQITEFDNSDSTFNLIGWYGHDFIYSLTSNNGNQWQSGSQVIKDYNADQHELNQLDQNQASGGSGDYAYQSFSNFYLVGNEIVYDTEWIVSGAYNINNDTDTIRVLQLNTQTKKDYEAFPSTSTGPILANRYQPQSIYFAVPNLNNNTTTYYQYEDQSVQAANINQSIFDQSNPTYLVSPSGKFTVWYELSNGQNLFFKGNSNAGDQQQIAALDNYVPYGWYSDNYIIASRGNDQLYIFPSSGLSGGHQPLVITDDYYEPNNTSNTYEYGGL